MTLETSYGVECFSHYKVAHAYFFGPSIGKTEPVCLLRLYAYNRTRDSEYSLHQQLGGFVSVRIL